MSDTDSLRETKAPLLAIIRRERAGRRVIVTLQSFVTSAPPRDRAEEQRKARERSAKRFGSQQASN